MMQVLPKWRIRAEFGIGDQVVVFHISDRFLSNVLRKLADIEFENQPSTLVVTIETSVGAMYQP